MGTHPIFESDFDCLTGLFRMLSRLVQPVVLKTPVRFGHYFTPQTAQYWKIASWIFGGFITCVSVYNCDLRMPTYDERVEFRQWHQDQCKTNWPFTSDKKTRDQSLFYNPAVNPNPAKGYADGDQKRRLYKQANGFLSNCAVNKGIPDPNSFEANIFNAEWRAAQGITDEEFEWMFENHFSVKYDKSGHWLHAPH